MRATIAIALALLSSAAIAQNGSEDTRDLPSPSAAGRDKPPPEQGPPEQRGSTGHVRARAGCYGEWVCGRSQLRANDSYTPGSYLPGVQVGGRWVEGPCRKQRRCERP